MKISDIELVPEGKGIFDVEIDGKLIFSKFQSGRFPDRGEIPGLISNQDSIKGIVNRSNTLSSTLSSPSKCNSLLASPMKSF